MEKQIERLRGGVARVASMQGIGWPRIAFAPPGDDNGGGDDGDKDGTGDAGGDDKGGNDKSGDDGAGKQSRFANSGLLNRRAKAGDGDGTGDDGDKSGEADPKDAPKDGRPVGLPEKFWDATKKAPKTDDLVKAYTDLEKAHGALKRGKGPAGEVPETPDGYFGDKFEVPEGAKNIPVPADDPGLKASAKIFHKYGIPKDVGVSIVKDMLVEMNDHVAAPLDQDAEMESLGKGGPALLDGIFVWAEGRVNAGDFSDDDANVIAGLSETAAGVRFLAKFREMSGEQKIPIDPGTGKRGMSFTQIQDKYKEAVKAGDYAEQERLDKMRDEMFPNQPLNLSGGYTSEKTVAR